MFFHPDIFNFFFCQEFSAQSVTLADVFSGVKYTRHQLRISTPNDTHYHNTNTQRGHRNITLRLSINRKSFPTTKATD